MILVGISKPRVYKDPIGGWSLAYAHMTTDTTEPDIYRHAAELITTMPVASHESGVTAASHLSESHRVFPVRTDVPWL